jgi:hypothetical protein
MQLFHGILIFDISIYVPFDFLKLRNVIFSRFKSFWNILLQKRLCWPTDFCLLRKPFKHFLSKLSCTPNQFSLCNPSFPFLLPLGIILRLSVSIHVASSVGFVVLNASLFWASSCFYPLVCFSLDAFRFRFSLLLGAFCWRPALFDVFCWFLFGVYTVVRLSSMIGS